MSNLGGLPNMGNKRLTVLQKQVHSTRKTTTILNDKLKESLDRLERSMDRQKQNEEFRCWQQSVPMKTSLQEKQALKKCLRHRRLSFSSVERRCRRKQNGVYDGASLDSMKGEVKQLLSEMTPAHRRIKRVEKLKSMGYRDGQLVHYQDSLSKFQDVLDRPRRKPKYPRHLAPYGLSPRYSLLMRELPLVMNTTRSLSSPSSSSSRSEDGVEGGGGGDDADAAHRRSASAEGTRLLPAITKQTDYHRSLPPSSRQTVPKLPPLTRRVSAFGPY